MPQSFDSVILHIVFSTKQRQPFIRGQVGDQMHGYLANVGRAQGCKVYGVGGVKDHVHLATSLPRTLCISDLVCELKTESSKWAKKQGAEFKAFGWQAGYGVFSISKSHAPALVTYIANQEQHHEAKTFQEEFLELLEKHELEWDEAYMWD